MEWAEEKKRSRCQHCVEIIPCAAVLCCAVCSAVCAVVGCGSPRPAPPHQSNKVINLPPPPLLPAIQSPSPSPSFSSFIAWGWASTQLSTYEARSVTSRSSCQAIFTRISALHNLSLQYTPSHSCCAVGNACEEPGSSRLAPPSLLLLSTPLLLISIISFQILRRSPDHHLSTGVETVDRTPTAPRP